MGMCIGYHHATKIDLSLKKMNNGFPQKFSQEKYSFYIDPFHLICLNVKIPKIIINNSCVHLIKVELKSTAHYFNISPINS